MTTKLFLSIILAILASLSFCFSQRRPIFNPRNNPIDLDIGSIKLSSLRDQVDNSLASLIQIPDSSGKISPINIDIPESKYLNYFLNNAAYTSYETEYNYLPMDAPDKVADSRVLERNIDLSIYLPFVGNQEESSTCIAWALGFGMMTIRENIILQLKYKTKLTSKPDSLVYSPSYLLNMYKVLYNDHDWAKPVTFVQLLNILHDYGIVRKNVFDYNPGNLGCCDPVPFEIQKKGKIKKISSFDNVAIDKLSMQSKLCDSIPIGLLIQVDDDFFEAGKNWKNKNEPFIYKKYNNQTTRYDLRGHGVVCVGYNDSLKAFLILNSQGIDFGNNGFFWLDYEFIEKSASDGMPVIREEYEIIDNRPDGLLSPVATKKSDKPISALVETPGTDMDIILEHGAIFRGAFIYCNFVNPKNTSVNLQFTNTATSALLTYADIDQEHAKRILLPDKNYYLLSLKSIRPSKSFMQTTSVKINLRKFK